MMLGRTSRLRSLSILVKNKRFYIVGCFRLWGGVRDVGQLEILQILKNHPNVWFTARALQKHYIVSFNAVSIAASKLCKYDKRITRRRIANAKVGYEYMYGVNDGETRWDFNESKRSK